MNEIFRPAAEKRKIHSKNEFELCYIRHQYFRRVKYNPTKEEMAPYRSVVRYMSSKTNYTYAMLLHTIGMTFDDVFAVGMVHLVNYLGLFEINLNKNPVKYEKFSDAVLARTGHLPTPEDILNKNKADLTLFLQQRFTDFVRICRQKAKNIKGFRVDEYVPFYGPTPPPATLSKLLEDNDAYGYRRLDNVAFKAIKKRAKAEIGVPFEWAGSWYVAVPLQQRSMTILDLAGAGLDPYESEHNMNPEQLLSLRQDESALDNQIKVYKNSTKEDKTKVLLGFIEKHSDNPDMQEEIGIAKRFLKSMGTVHGG